MDAPGRAGGASVQQRRHPAAEGAGDRVFVAEQFEQLQREAGTMADDLVNTAARNGAMNVETPTKKDIEKIRKLRARARSAVLKRLRPEWLKVEPEGVQ